MKARACLTWAALAVLAFAAPVAATDLTDDFERGEVVLSSGGPLAFAPDGILLVGDAASATIYAIDTKESAGNPDEVSINIDSVDKTLAASLGASAGEITINDLAVNPATGTAYVSVSRGRGPDADTVIMRVGGDGELNEFPLDMVSHSSAKLPNAPSAEETDRRGNPLRTMSITDISYVDGRVIIAGLSNEEFASTLRAIEFPFDITGSGTAVEIFHGAHGRYETNAPIRTFTPISIDNEPYIVAAYTCTPLVKFPLTSLSDGEKLRGTTVAELGNRNRPLDMFVYEKGGEEFILMANSARGTMKIRTEGIDRDEGITERISGTAGQTYDTIDDLEGVVQLDRLNSDHALVVISNDSGTSLRTIKLP